MIPGARLLSFPVEGHVIALIEQEVIGSAARKYILDHASELHAQALATLAGGVRGEA